ncbi:capsule polysaccharide export protein [Azorhizobium oxalatiphilum]|uniref:Capsule polysaccharide export protein n=1 Tax=Azorhizobium oxalatiphilum TaxID=980631 RepID=A0A917CAW2_9HYPH|nr:hypothetical protein [Azorhizobium oxalatiphilum]GGF80203.1 capsule polysaccharide export protein [Azorhizobium oxalatiphilum]
MNETATGTTRPEARIADQQPLQLPARRRIELVPIQAQQPADGPQVGEDPHAKPLWRRYGLFAVLFALPVLSAIVYFGLIASDVYLSEAKFLVRSSARSTGASLSSMIQSESMARAADETYAVSEYMISRDAAAALAKTAGLRDIMQRSEADMFNRYPSFFGKENEDQFFRAYKRLVSVETDGATGISTLVARAYRPEDAEVLAAALIQTAEQFVNKLNLRSNEDAVKFSEAMVKDAQVRLSDVETRLATYRNTQLVVDPEKESTASLAILGRMTTEIARLEASLSQQMAMAPESPAIAPLRERIVAYRAEMQKQQKNVVGGANSIASKLQGYELLVIERELAARAMAVATASLESARQEAQSQRIYLQKITEPSLPDQADQPKRMQGILVVAFLAFCIYWIARSIISNTMEHQA